MTIKEQKRVKRKKKSNDKKTEWQRWLMTKRTKIKRVNDKKRASAKRLKTKITKSKERMAKVN